MISAISAQFFHKLLKILLLQIYIVYKCQHFPLILKLDCLIFNGVCHFASFKYDVTILYI